MPQAWRVQRQRTEVILDEGAERGPASRRPRSSMASTPSEQRPADTCVEVMVNIGSRRATLTSLRLRRDRCAPGRALLESRIDIPV